MTTYHTFRLVLILLHTVYITYNITNVLCFKQQLADNFAVLGNKSNVFKEQPMQHICE